MPISQYYQNSKEEILTMKNTNIKCNDLFAPGVKLNFQVVSALNLTDKNMEHIYLVGSAILSGHLCNVSFYNASFLSTKFSDVTFEGCDLKSIDICSVWANNCCFQTADFSNATISDSTFVNCKFDGSIFQSISLTGCQFINCTFEQFLIDDSTFSLNKFTNCHIKQTNFTESFYYQIFDDCIFDDVNMPPELLGFNFGFSQDVFSKLTEGVNLKEVETDFINKGFYTNAAILRINQIHNSYDEALIACVAALGRMTQNDILIKADEINFLKNLTSYLLEHKQIAPITILRTWKLLTSCFMVGDSNTAISKAKPYISEYTNMLYFSFLDFQENLQKCLGKLSTINNIKATVELKIVYLEKPSFPLINYLTEFSQMAAPDCPMPKLIRTEKGSFIEILEAALPIIPYVQTFLALLGVIVPIVIYEKQKQDNKEQQEKATETSFRENGGIEITLSTANPKQSSILIPNTNTILPTTNTLVSNVSKIIETTAVHSNDGFAGYNAKNIQSISIRFY